MMPNEGRSFIEKRDFRQTSRGRMRLMTSKRVMSLRIRMLIFEELTGDFELMARNFGTKS